jgi:hypothetical protein
MHRTIAAIGIVMSMTFWALAPAQAVDQDVKANRQRVGAVKPPREILDEQLPQRACDWIGPGGRAVYRCHVIN